MSLSPPPPLSLRVYQKFIVKFKHRGLLYRISLYLFYLSRINDSDLSILVNRRRSRSVYLLSDARACNVRSLGARGMAGKHTFEKRFASRFYRRINKGILGQLASTLTVLPLERRFDGFVCQLDSKSRLSFGTRLPRTITKCQKCRIAFPPESRKMKTRCRARNRPRSQSRSVGAS